MSAMYSRQRERSSEADGQERHRRVCVCFFSPVKEQGRRRPCRTREFDNHVEPVAFRPASAARGRPAWPVVVIVVVVVAVVVVVGRLDAF